MTEFIKPTLFFGKGTILLLSEGEYSDFGYCAQLVTLVDIDLARELKEWKEGLGKNQDGKLIAETYEYGPGDFCAYLVTTQKCAPLECQQVHIGNYGSVEL